MKIFVSTITVCFILFPILLIAQPGGDPGGGGNPTVPISGIEILIGAGGAIGLKKLLNKRKIK